MALQEKNQSRKKTELIDDLTVKIDNNEIVFKNGKNNIQEKTISDEHIGRIYNINYNPKEIQISITSRPSGDRCSRCNGTGVEP